MARIIISILIIFSLQSQAQIALWHAHNVTPSNLFLDLYGTDVTAAFSLRKLRTAYTGFCLRIERASDNATRDIGFVNDYIDSADIKSWMGGSGTARVLIWYDQSGGGRNLQRVNANEGPNIYLSGTYLDELRTDNTITDGMQWSASPTDLRPYVSATSGSNFIVFRQVTDNGGAIFIQSAGDAPHHSWSDNNAYDGFLSTNRVSFSGYNPTTTFKAHSAHNNGSTLTLYKSNTLIDAAKSITFAGTPSNQSLSTGSVFGNIAWKEVILYTSTKTTDRSNMTSNQITFFGL